MSQPEIWVSISIRGSDDGVGQPPAKVLDLKITTSTGDAGPTSTVLAAPRQAQTFPARSVSSSLLEPLQDDTGQIPVVNIVIGDDADDTADRSDGFGGTVYDPNIPGASRGNGGCVGSFTGRRGNRATTSAGSGGAVETVAGKAVSIASAHGGAGSGGDGATTDIDAVNDAKGGYAGHRGNGWTGTDGKGGQGGTVFANGYKSIAVAGFGGTGQTGNGVAASNNGTHANVRDQFDYFDADSAADPEGPGDGETHVDEGLTGPWGRGGYAAANGFGETGTGANGVVAGLGAVSTNGHSGSDG